MSNYTEQSRNRAIQTCNASLGCDWPMQSPETQTKSKQSLIERYGVDNYAKCRYLVSVDVDAELRNAEIYGNTAMIIADPQKLINSNYYVSLCKELNSRMIDYAIAFPWDDVDNLRHQLRPRRELFTEQCEIYRIPVDTANQFLSRYDYRPVPRGQLLCLGHVWNGKIVQIMTFGKVRNPRRYHIKMMRCITIPEIVVIGGYNTLSYSASLEFGISDVCVTCDNSKQVFNKVYPLLGMGVCGTAQTARHIINERPMYDCGYTVYGT